MRWLSLSRAAGLAVLSVIIMLASSPPAAAWGATGHAAICELAFRELGPGPRAEVERLMGLDAQYETFAEACNWADGPPRQRERDHYVNVHRDTRAIVRDGCPAADTCILAAVRNDVAVLENPVIRDAERLQALKLLGHWVGDLHQPMHVTFGDDRGANAIAALLRGAGDGDEDVETNLHELWDDWIIARRLGDDYRQIAERLQQAVTDADRDAWRYDHPVEWANESFQIARHPSTRYCFERDGACWYAADNLLLSAGESRRQMTLDDRYIALHALTVERRLRQAGIRLAALLERVLETRD